MFNLIKLPHIITVVLVSAIGFSNVSLAESSSTKDSNQKLTLVGNNKISESEIIKLLDKAVPLWSNKILDARSEGNPIAKLDFNFILDVLNDQMSNLPPEEATQAFGKINAINLNKKTGKFRYVNRERTWSFERDSKKKLIPKRSVGSIVSKLLTEFQIPKIELNRPIIRSQIAAGAKVGSKQLQDKFEMYQIAYIQRRINGLSILQSDIKVAINHQGQVQRLSIDWPEFKLDEQIKLKSRRSVLQSAAKEIMLQDPDSDLVIKSKLAYAKINDDNFHQPVAVLSINSLPTPYQLIIKLTDSLQEYESE
jgi:hemin uptake protein HemP